jgi:hypothetical protein
VTQLLTRPGKAGYQSALVPVTDWLLNAARARAAACIAQAERDASATLAIAEASAARTIDAARAEGIQAAETGAAREMSSAQSEGREMVLVARRQAYESLRSESIRALGDRLMSPANRLLYKRLVDLVAARGGGGTVARADHAPGWQLAAGTGTRQAVFDLESLVDRALQTVGSSLEAL